MRLSIELSKRVLNMLAQRGVAYRLIQHPPEANCIKVSALRGHAPAEAIKAMLVAVKRPTDKTLFSTNENLEQRYILALLSGDVRVDFKRLKNSLGAESATIASEDRVRELLYSEPGAISPFSFNPKVPVIMDTSLTRPDIKNVYFSAGRTDESVTMSAEAFIKISGERGIKITSFGIMPPTASSNESLFKTTTSREEKRYILIEACYHAAYFVTFIADLLEDPRLRYKVIVRSGKKKLDSEKLTLLHEKLHGKKDLTERDLSELYSAYDGLSKSELALIKMEGVPRFHVFSFPGYSEENLNGSDIKKMLEEEKDCGRLSAAIFLDCILAPWWLEFFENRIVNAHSAVLPHARGMYAIEQVAAKGDSDVFTRSAGASIHYIDKGVDTGPLIARSSLGDELWGKYNSIWQVKAASYLRAFQLMNEYLRGQRAFTRTDIMRHDDPLGPEYRARDFTEGIQVQAENEYARMREIMLRRLCEQKLIW